MKTALIHPFTSMKMYVKSFSHSLAVFSFIFHSLVLLLFLIHLIFYEMKNENCLYV